MGWSGATRYFDAVAEAADEVLDDLQIDAASKHDYLLRILKPLAEELNSGDWDTHRESDYWDEFKWDLWPEEAQEEHEEKLDDAYGA